MADYQEYINALTRCSKKHKNDRTFTGHIIVSDLCQDTANLLEGLEQETRWVSVSERLPKRSGEYLVSVIDGSGEDNDYEAVGVAWFAHKKDYAIAESEWRELGIDETVVAWMPLPEPYRAERSGEE